MSFSQEVIRSQFSHKSELLSYPYHTECNLPLKITYSFKYRYNIL